MAGRTGSTSLTRVRHAVVIGAGVGGLTAAALLLRGGLRVTVLEAHVYPGGSAGTFYHRGFRFDAGATLAGGFAPGGPHARIAELLDLDWPIHPVDPAWVVHLPGTTITQWADRDRWQAERAAAFPGTERFWDLQARLARIAWDISARPFPWPPASARDWPALARAARPGTLAALPYVTRALGGLLPARDARLRAFVDAQLMISAQTTAARASALYGSAALDLPRRGVYQVDGGIGTLARTLADWVTGHGGEVLYRQQVERVETRAGRALAVHTNKGLRVGCDLLLADLTPWGLARLLGDDSPGALQRETRARPATWGAFTLYLGLDAAALPEGAADHHQVVVDPARPLGEGNSVFVSLSRAGDSRRAPPGMRAATLSTHTAVAPWWKLHAASRAAYEERRDEYAERLLAAAEIALPGLRRAVRLALPGTPVTFERFTRRPLGMVGGFPQTSLLRARGPGTGLANAWLVGDSVFPGQSTAGVTLGALRVARDALAAPIT